MESQPGRRARSIIHRIKAEDRKNGGRNLRFNYQHVKTPLGRVFIASTPKGIARLVFAQKAPALGALQREFPHARFVRKSDALQRAALLQLNTKHTKHSPVPVHVTGTDFQVRVWDALLRTKPGQLTTYSAIAHDIRRPTARRAVGSAIGRNTVALLIPCHRVIRSDGTIGGYRWGVVLKSTLIEREQDGAV